MTLTNPLWGRRGHRDSRRFRPGKTFRPRRRRAGQTCRLSTEPIYAGFDIATRLSGWTVGDGEAVPEVGHWSWPDRGDDIGQLLDDFDQDFNALRHRTGFNTVGCEAPFIRFRGRKGSQRNDNPVFVFKIGALIGHLRWLCHRLDFPLVMYDPETVKLALAGFRKAEKSDMVAVAKKVGIRLSTGEAKKDEADAFGVWLSIVRERDRKLGERWDRVIYGRQGALL